jgi:predicted transcriptional regulator
MGTTTLKLPEELKERVASVVNGTGRTAHAFMVEAIEQQTRLAEQRRQFVDAALAADREFARSRKGYALEDVAKYLLARAAGKRTRRPRLKRWPK